MRFFAKQSTLRRKCLQLYFYFIDRDFGLMHVRLQTWFPMQIQSYLNGYESGASISSGDIVRALLRHGELLNRMRTFQQTHEFILCAVNQMPPFDAKLDWPHEIEGVKMENYVAWMKSACWITATFCPAISVPAGFTSEGLLVGIQIVGRYGHPMRQFDSMICALCLRTLVSKNGKG